MCSFKALIGCHYLEFTTVKRPMNWNKYHRLNEIYAYLNYLADTYQSIVQMLTIGSSYEGRPLHVVHISTNFSDTDRPAIWMDGGTFFLLTSRRCNEFTNRNACQGMDFNIVDYAISKETGGSSLAVKFTLVQSRSPSRKPEPCQLSF